MGDEKSIQARKLVVLAPYLQRTYAGAAHATINIIDAMSKRHPGSVSVAAFNYDAKLFSPDVQFVKLDPPRSIRFFWRFPSYVFLHQSLQRMRSAALPRATLAYTQSTGMGLAFRRLYPWVPVVSHTGAVLSDQEHREEALRPAIESSIEGYVINYLEKRSYRQPNWRHIVSTRVVAREREKYFRLPSGFFRVQPLGIDLARFNPFTAHENMRARYEIPPDAFVIVTVARLVKLKSVDMILQAVALSRENPWVFVVGAGPEAQSLEALAVGLKINHRVRFVGHADPVPFLACGDVFVLPSKIESFGMVYAEAMSMGLPCLGLRHRPPEVLSSAVDVIPEGKAGFCVDSVDQLRERIDWFATNRDAAREMGQFAQCFAKGNYSIDRYIDTLDELHQEVLESGPQGFS